MQTPIKFRDKRQLFLLHIRILCVNLAYFDERILSIYKNVK